MPPPLPYLRPAELAPLRHLVFGSRRAVHGHYAGQHASPQRGHSVEFQDYREYTPGDPLQDIDWKAYGRSDKLFIKLFEHQSDMTVRLLVDASGSMAYRGLGSGVQGLGSRLRRRRFSQTPDPRPQTRSKFDHAASMAAAIGFLVTQQQDKVGLAVARGGLAMSLPPRGTYPHLHRLAGELGGVDPAGPARLAVALQGLARQSRRKGLLVVLSDLEEARDSILSALGRFLHAGHEVIVLQVLHEDELHLPDWGEAVLVDSETGREVRVNLDEIRDDYEAKLHGQLDGWRRTLAARGIDHHVVSTATPYAEALRRYLFTRASLS